MYPRGRPLTRQVDLNLLELFDTVFKTRNLTGAGGQLGLSQPAVSYGLSKLREAYGDPLFVRQQRGVRPTPLAERLAEPIAHALQLVRGTIEKLAFVPGEARHTFRIGMSDIGERYFLPRLAQRLGKEAPGVSMEALSPGRDELADGLASGDIDLAIGFTPGLGKQVREQPLFSERFVYLMRADHHALDTPLSAARVRTLRHVVASPEGTNHLRAVEAVLNSAKVGAEIVLRVKSFLCVGPIVAETDLVGLVPSNLASLVAPHLGLAVRKPLLRFDPFEIAMYWNRRFDQDPASTWLRETVRELFGDGAHSGS